MVELYILYSQKIDQYYVGQTIDLEDRLPCHNAGKSLSTKKGMPWELSFSTAFETRFMEECKTFKNGSCFWRLLEESGFMSLIKLG